MDYFYSPPDNISNGTIIINGDEYNHLVHVMRKKEGDLIRIVDGAGTAYDAALSSLKKKTASATILKAYHHHNESDVSITLAVGILKNPSRFDFLVEKATEIGVKEIIPMTTERTIPSHAKTERWQKLALAAMKQSRRSVLPRVHTLTSFSSLLESRQHYDIALIAHNNDDVAFLPSRDSNAGDHILILVGPEGGFSDTEIENARSAGCVPFSLGTRRLRTETAAIVALVRVMSKVELPKGTNPSGKIF